MCGRCGAGLLDVAVVSARAGVVDPDLIRLRWLIGSPSRCHCGARIAASGDAGMMARAKEAESESDQKSHHMDCRRVQEPVRSARKEFRE